MKKITKFIINRNDLEYYLVEKVQNGNKIFYNVYFDANTKMVFNQDNFHAIFGLDEKISVQKYIYRMRYNEKLSFNDMEANLKEKILDSINSQTINNKDYRNPKVDVSELLKGIDFCNRLISLDESLIDYEDNYNLVSRKNNESRILNNVYSDQIRDNIFTRDDNLSLESGIERIRKYDN